MGYPLMQVLNRKLLGKISEKISTLDKSVALMPMKWHFMIMKSEI